MLGKATSVCHCDTQLSGGGGGGGVCVLNICRDNVTLQGTKRPKMHHEGHQLRAESGAFPRGGDSGISLANRGMFLVLSLRFGARRRILEPVTAAHLLYVKKQNYQNFICTVSVFSDSEGERLIILPEVKKGIDP